MRRQQNLNEILGEILSKSSLPEVFGIDTKNFSFQKYQEGLQVLAGFLKEAADGNVADPNDLPTWQATGEQILSKKIQK